MENPTKHIQKLHNSCHAEDLVIQNFFSRFSQLLEHYSQKTQNNTDILLKISERGPNKEIITPGIPGYFKDALVAIDSAFSHINQNCVNIGRKITKKMDKHIKDSTAQDSEFEKAIAEMNSSGKDLNDILSKQVKKASNSDLSKKLDSALSKMSKGKNDKGAAQLNEIYQSILTQRKALAPKRQEIMSSAKDTCQAYVNATEKVVNSINNRNSEIIKIFDELGIEYVEMVAGMQTDITNLESTAKSFDYQKDLAEFAKSRKIVRYDIEVPDLEVFDFDEDPEANIPMNDYPIGMAEIVLSFAAAVPPEMSCTKGNRMFLMEEPAEEWCCVMNPFTKNVGFVPSYCINQTCFSIGIVMKDPAKSDCNGVNVRKHEFLGILENNPQESFYKVENIYGQQGKVAKNIIGLLY
ncbi:hypothetical protein TRFO_12680 [Tritrichomonas foetus]|uniref:SH3 domain-containing protein n=1 Tax=Tritrichomonas foetus TaxID=1144522 RepID=A0A1J4L5D5_9EUKA|nr:hypothetical protein TRFO_12680 [Tritrichomonas foetus]|eukprot:OHT17150.1 hypothetical protein TRFO_12680 [Tritrichomonas foetus]